MSFRSPLVLLLAAVLVPGVLALVAYAARQRAHALRLFLGAGRDRQPGLAGLARRRTVRAGLLAGALAGAAVALAGPRIGTALRESQQESLDLVIALDVSDSMRADDVAPSRLERAKLEVERIVSERRGDRVGLVLFAGEAFLQCPLTTDRSALRLFLDAADPEQVAVQGTDFARALAVADQAFNAAGEGQTDRPRALLVVSDGEDHEGGLEAEADALRDDGVTLLALGVGTDEGAPVPNVYRGRVTGDRTDGRGAALMTRFEPGALLDLAGRGNVYRVGRRPAAPEINRALDAMDRAVVSQDQFSAEAERFQWPLGLALLLLVAERIVALRRPRSHSSDPTDASTTGSEALAADRAAPHPAGANRPTIAIAAGLTALGNAAAVVTDPVAGDLREQAGVLVLVYVLAGWAGLRIGRRQARSATRREVGIVVATFLAWGLAITVLRTRWIRPPFADINLILALAVMAGPLVGVGWAAVRQRAARATAAAVALAVLMLGGCTLDALQPGVAGGRAGVELLETGDAPAAEAAFVAALAQRDVPRGVQARLWQSLGVARAQQEKYAQADSAFSEALARADAPRQRARYAFDAGTAALLADDAPRADSLLRRALILAPGRADARRNQEIARRRIQDPPAPPEPSDFAERLKARADSLVAARQYRAALDVMEDGLARDSSVAAYDDFVQRLGGVVQIEETVPASRDSTTP